MDYISLRSRLGERR